MKTKLFKLLSLLMAILMLFSSVFVAPVAVAETSSSSTSPLYIEEDYENVADGYTFKTDNMTATVVDDGSNSNKVLQLSAPSADAWCGSELLGFDTPILPKNNTYHITGSFKVISGAFGLSAVGLMQIQNGNINIWHIGTAGISINPNHDYNKWWTKTITPTDGLVNFSVTYTSNGYSAFGIMFKTQENIPDNIIQFDNIKIAEVIPSENIVATSDDETKGKVAVTNANAKYNTSSGSTFAFRETAVFNAVANYGYKFAGWKNSNGETVPGGARLEVEVSGELSLTAAFAPSDKEYNIYIDFENVSTLSKTDNFSVVREPESDTFNRVVLYKGTKATQPDVNRRFIVTYNDFNKEKLNDIYTKGDSFTIEFRYKYLSDDAEEVSYYFGANSNSGNAWNINNSPNAFGGNAVKSKILTNPKDGSWVTEKRVVDIIGDDPEKYLYIVMLLGGDSDVYFDDFMIYQTHSISVNFANEAVRIEADNINKSFTDVLAHRPITFKAFCDKTVTPVIKYGEQILTSADGVYTIDSVNTTDELNITSIGQTTAQSHAVGVGLNGEDLTTYNADVYTKPYWEGDTTYHEAVLFTSSKCEKQLLYPIDDVISVRNYDLKTWYVKGIDFDVINGKLVWLENSKIPLYGSDSTEIDASDEDNRKKSIVYVTYTHTKTWAETEKTGYVPCPPEAQGTELYNFYKKLKTAEDINVLVYNDITSADTEGYKANINYEIFAEDGTVTERKTSGTEFFVPTFFEQSTAALISKYGNNNKINYYNIGLAGKNLKWAIDNIYVRVGYMNDYYRKKVVPDLIYINFGENDILTDINYYKTNLDLMVKKFKKIYPKADIILVSDKLNNSEDEAYKSENVLAMERATVNVANNNDNCIYTLSSTESANINSSKDADDLYYNNRGYDYWATTTAQFVTATAGLYEFKTMAENKAAVKAQGDSANVNKQGIRIYNKIAKSFIDENNIAEYGTIAIRYTKIGDAELNINTVGVAKGIAYSNGSFDETPVSNLWKSEMGCITYTAYLTGISEKFYGEDYIVRAYAKDKEGNVYYGDTKLFCVYDIVQAIDAAGNSAPEKDKATAAFIKQQAEAAKLTDLNVVTFDEWKNR